jgi:cytochrome c oxidase assembly protein subunit 15
LFSHDRCGFRAAAVLFYAVKMNMPASKDSRTLHWFAVFTALMTLGLLVIGGLVTSHGVGMAVPDWPNTYGYNMFLFPVSQWIGGILYEHSHRLVAAGVGLLTTILACWIWSRETVGRTRWLGVGSFIFVVGLLGVRRMEVYYALVVLAVPAIIWALRKALQTPGSLRWWGVVAFASVVLQGVLGGLRVVRIQDGIGIFHATLAQLFFVLVCGIALATSRVWQVMEIGTPSGARKVARWFLVATVLVLLQLVLGASMRHQHAGLAIPDFPLAYGRVWPDTSADAVTRYNQQRLEITAVKPITAAHIYLQMAHRLLAVVVGAAIFGSALAARQRLGAGHVVSKLGLAWAGLVLAQVGLGAWTIWSNKAADIATIHMLAGALTLALGGIACMVIFVKLKIAMQAVPSANIWPSPRAQLGRG